jgi:hypothetical protein
MGHGLYDSMHTPWVMDRTVVQKPHGPWIVQPYPGYRFSMGHGLYGATKGIDSPWVMECTTQPKVLIPHGSWTVQCN